jgi:two-component system sensor histidine kinase CpxA
MAERLESMILGGRELTAHVSHELRSPLARIRVAEELLRQELEEGDDGDLIRHLDSIREDIGELDHLIGRILLLSKMDIQETPLKKESFDPNELIRTLSQKLEHAIDRKRLSVLKNFGFDRSIFGDRKALGTVFSNVLDNAVKFTPEKGSITVTTHSEDFFLVIDVTNTCETLSAGELSKIFEPFYRMKTANSAGTGLGLPIAKKIIEKHGGSIEATNTEAGLRIRMRIPSRQGFA